MEGQRRSVKDTSPLGQRNVCEDLIALQAQAAREIIQLRKLCAIITLVLPMLLALLSQKLLVLLVKRAILIRGCPFTGGGRRSNT